MKKLIIVTVILILTLISVSFILKRRTYTQNDLYKLVDHALVTNKESLCDGAHAYYEDHSDYGYNHTTEEAVYICKGIYHGIKGDSNYCESLSEDHGKNYCTYFTRWYPLTLDACLKTSWAGSENVASFCTSRLNKCPLLLDSKYCTLNKLVGS